jgi:hypothetical protein
MGITNIVSMLQVLKYSRQYDAIITNITTANSISGSIKPDIDNEMWKIVSGTIQFSLSISGLAASTATDFMLQGDPSPWMNSSWEKQRCRASYSAGLV